MNRRTKIVATLGPATSSSTAICELISAGANVVRMNFSHGAAQDHIDRANLVREHAMQQKRFVAILADLQGPKIRIARFAEGKVQLVEGQTFTLDASQDKEQGTQDSVGIDYEALINDSAPGD
ncbi:MAG: pyruvate kinase, partial [Pontibacterium sp.]